VLKLDGRPFTSSRSKYSDHVPQRLEPTAKIYVRISFEGMDRVVTAQLDTGAAWSILGSETAERLGLFSEPGETVRLLTSFGIKEGVLVRVPLKIVADEGESLDVTGTFFVAPDWPEGLTFLGYSGLLDSFRFALDPQVNDFYFGRY
jgi:hypothetical protein